MDRKTIRKARDQKPWAIGNFGSCPPTDHELGASAIEALPRVSVLHLKPRDFTDCTKDNCSGVHQLWKGPDTDKILLTPWVQKEENELSYRYDTTGCFGGSLDEAVSPVTLATTHVVRRLHLPRFVAEGDVAIEPVAVIVTGYFATHENYVPSTGDLIFVRGLWGEIAVVSTAERNVDGVTWRLGCETICG